MADGPATYTHGHDESVLRSHRWRSVANSAPHLEPLLNPGTSVLDVGCGPGTITADIAARVAPGRVVAIDSAPAAVDAAQAAIAGSGATNVDVRVADLYDLPFEPASFDVVHAHQVLQHLADPVGALEAMRRVRTADGVVAVRDVDYGALTWFPDEPALDRWLAVYSAVHRANGAEPDAGRRLLSWARAAGFADITASSTSWCFATPEDRTWWATLWADRTTTTVLGVRAVELGLATTGELADIAAGWHRWAAHDDGWFLVPHGELLCRG
jgi:ubiquinone/menaquinone biosynthesis C-methylase UbiE